jgi:multidrug efflux pump subunit AcrB
VVAETIGVPLEEAVNGVEHMTYMSSTSSSDGSYTLTITFDIGTDLDKSLVLVQNQVNSSLSQLPGGVQVQGVSVKKVSTNILLVVSLYSEDDRFDEAFFSNYGIINMQYPLARESGVGLVRVFGAGQYSMRVWLDPNRLRQFGLTTADVLNAIAAQNVKVVAGQLGAPPVPSSQAFQFSINSLGWLSDAEEFEDIIVKTSAGPSAQMVRLRDIADVQLGQQSYSNFALTSGHESAQVVIFALPEANAPYRVKMENIPNLYTRNAHGERVPLGSLLKLRHIQGSELITRYNLYPAAAIFGSSAPGFSSGQALAIMEQLAGRVLPSGMGYDWTAASYQEKQIGYQAYFIYALAVTLVFMVLTALYESWTSPAAVALVVPVAMVGVLVALPIRGYDKNIYTQIRLVLMIALASKNAILIVEFARDLHRGGTSITEAAVEATGRRFRPIVMTSFAFILGVSPLLLATGAGAASQRAIGTVVFGGMLTSTLLAIPFVPVFYVLMQRLSEWRKRGHPLPRPRLQTRVSSARVLEPRSRGSGLLSGTWPSRRAARWPTLQKPPFPTSP